MSEPRVFRWGFDRNCCSSMRVRGWASGRAPALMRAREQRATRRGRRYRAGAREEDGLRVGAERSELRQRAVAEVGRAPQVEAARRGASEQQRIQLGGGDLPPELHAARGGAGLAHVRNGLLRERGACAASAHHVPYQRTSRLPRPSRLAFVAKALE